MESSDVRGDPGRDLEIVFLQRGVDLVELVRISFARLHAPPENALDDDGERRNGGEQDWKHDPTALVKVLHD